MDFPTVLPVVVPMVVEGVPVYPEVGAYLGYRPLVLDPLEDDHPPCSSPYPRRT